MLDVDTAHQLTYNRSLQCCWFSVEFGLCRQEGRLKAFGGGLLSSFGELEYSLSDKSVTSPFDLSETAIQECPITQYQSVYYVSESIDELKQKLMWDNSSRQSSFLPYMSSNFLFHHLVTTQNPSRKALICLTIHSTKRWKLSIEPIGKLANEELCLKKKDNWNG